MDPEQDVKQNFWRTILKAAEAEPRAATRIPGATGIEHPVLAVGVDEKRHRLIVVSAEGDARSAALAQADIQAGVDDLQVVMLRPVVADLAPVAKALQSITGQPEFDLNAITELVQAHKLDALAGPLNTLVESFGYAKLDMMRQFSQVLQQLFQLSMRLPQRGDAPDPPKTLIVAGLDKLAAIDPIREDRELGICPIPLFRISPEYAEILQHGDDLDSAREALRRLDVFQYFFPPPDQVALAVLDRCPGHQEAIETSIVAAPRLGHPLGPYELVPANTPLPEVLDELEQRGYVAEGEVSTVITEKGKEVRSQIRFAPRESLSSKLLNRISIRFDLADLLKR